MVEAFAIGGGGGAMEGAEGAGTEGEESPEARESEPRGDEWEGARGEDQLICREVGRLGTETVKFNVEGAEVPQVLTAVRARAWAPGVEMVKG